MPHGECEKNCEVWLPFGYNITTCLIMPIHEDWEMIKKYDMREKYIIEKQEEESA